MSSKSSVDTRMVSALFGNGVFEESNLRSLPQEAQDAIYAARVEAAEAQHKIITLESQLAAAEEKSRRDTSDWLRMEARAEAAESQAEEAIRDLERLQERVAKDREHAGVMLKEVLAVLQTAPGVVPAVALRLSAVELATGIIARLAALTQKARGSAVKKPA